MAKAITLHGIQEKEKPFLGEWAVSVSLELLEAPDAARDTVPMNGVSPKALSRMEGWRESGSYCESVSP